MPNDCSDFKGFHNIELPATVHVAVSLSLLSCLIPIHPLGGLFSLALSVFSFYWFRLHGSKLTRHEIVCFDEVSFLAATPSGTDSTMIPLMKNTGTESLIELIWQYYRDLLFPKADEQTERLQAFYRQHYGSVWKTAERARNIRELNTMKRKFVARNIVDLTEEELNMIREQMMNNAESPSLLG